MLIKTHPSMNVIYSTHQTTLKELEDFTGTAVKELYKYVVDLDLLVCGPQYWFYYGVDGDPNTRFTLEVALPVQGRIPTNLLAHFKAIPPYRCLVSRHEGVWDTIRMLNDDMIQYVWEKGLMMNGIYSEAYLHIDFGAPENNITEVGIGLV